MNCATPLDPGMLTDYWRGALPQYEEEAIEEHLFACDECGDRLREVMALAGAICNLARQGSLLMVVSDAFLKRVAEEGLHVREYTPPIGGSVACTVPTANSIGQEKVKYGSRGERMIRCWVHDCFACGKNRRGVTFPGLKDRTGVCRPHLY